MKHVLLAVCAFAIGCQSAAKAPATAPIVRAVAGDGDDRTRIATGLIIVGDRFGAAPVVTWNGAAKETLVLATVSEKRLHALFTAGMPEGHYTLTVSNGAGSVDTPVDVLRGEPGAIGPAGAPGPEGTAGPQGDPGPAGANGTNGANGAPGATGPMGSAGAAGVPGVTGPMGPAGSASGGAGTLGGLDAGQFLRSDIDSNAQARVIALGGFVAPLAANPNAAQTSFKRTTTILPQQCSFTGSGWIKNYYSLYWTLPLQPDAALTTANLSTAAVTDVAGDQVCCGFSGRSLALHTVLYPNGTDHVTVAVTGGSLGTQDYHANVAQDANLADPGAYARQLFPLFGGLPLAGYQVCFTNSGAAGIAGGKRFHFAGLEVSDDPYAFSGTTPFR